jgi:hypothetical protein
MIDDVRHSGTLTSSRSGPTALLECECGCGCNCTCICICYPWGANKQANFNASLTNGMNSTLNNRWYNNAVAGQGP